MDLLSADARGKIASDLGGCASNEFGSLVFERLNAVFAADPDIDELGFIISAPVSFDDVLANVNLPFVSVEHKLGMPFWALPSLCKHASSVLRSVKSNPTQDAQLTLASTRACLLVNADSYTAWNARKKLVRGGLRAPREEIRFLDVLATKHPKSGESWAHRRWTMQQLAKEDGVTGEDLSNEVRMCQRVAEVYPKNYYAWTHRLWVLSTLGSLSDMHADLKSTASWARQHVSDNCGFHHRRALLHRIQQGEAPEALSAAFVDEWDLCSDLITRYPGHETLWVHRRFLWEASLELQDDRLPSMGGEVAFAEVRLGALSPSLTEEQRRGESTNIGSYRLWMALRPKGSNSLISAQQEAHALVEKDTRRHRLWQHVVSA